MFKKKVRQKLTPIVSELNEWSKRMTDVRPTRESTPDKSFTDK
jgi:hypothetical protein